MDKKERADKYCEYLAELGYRPKIDSDGDVEFMREGKHLWVVVSEKDEEYFQVIVPGIWRFDDDDAGKVYLACVKVTADTKVAKVYPVKDKVWVSVEMFCATPEAVKPVFNRAVKVASLAAGKFTEIMKD